VPVLRWSLRERGRSLVVWGLAVSAVSALYMAFYPSMANEDMESLIAGLPEALREGMGWDRIATGAGYLESTVYGLLAPALLLVFAVTHGARLLAGEEEVGTLELESTAPVGRQALALQRFGTLALCLAVLVAVLAGATVVLVPAFDMGVSAGGTLAAALGLWLFALAMGAVTFAVGAATGRRGTALTVGSGVAVASYMGHALGPAAPGAEWLETVSPFAWYLGGDPLVAGVDPAGYLALVALIVLALVAGVVAFGRRDLGV
jgi:ABC-2 type transport system permease protein